MSTKPIGIFDSGVGGTSIWKEIHKLLPNENTIYLADSINAPYGPKGKNTIIDLSIKNTDFLLDKGAKLIVVACNTATTSAIDYLRNHYDIPFIGIEPAIKPAALKTQTGAIGILATKGTLSSELFSRTSSLFASNIKVIEQNGDGIVELIESGKLYSNEMKALLLTYLKPMIEANIDYLVLGCTHYPYLIPLLIDLTPNNIKIIDSGAAVAKQCKAILEKYRLINNLNSVANFEFYTTGSSNVLASLVNENVVIQKI
ncbi:glutamate racemase [Cognatitamlana onchidii]|uniref:glutamate racemase n=1 Tax=Cognatitamlana onchidii TaxID=2562860 RepID=UPI0010A5A907|nr:glutamate racemase [Algibacter onchidii]